MNCIVRNTVLFAAVAATTLAVMPMAEAGERWRHHGRRAVVVHQQDDAGTLIAAGILGLAVGAIAAGVVADSQPPAEPIYTNPYRRPRPDIEYFPPAPAYVEYERHAYAYEPWSREWFRYCAERYRSFDPSDGTFTTYRGEKRFCVAE